MARRYSPLTVVALVGAFALLGYMGARLSQQQALLQKTAAPPPAVHLADQKKTVAPSERDGKMLAVRTPADAAKSLVEPADTSAQTRLAAPPPNESVGQRTTVSPAAPEPLQPTPPAVPLKEGSGPRDFGQIGPDAAEMLSNPADTTRSDERRSRLAERAQTARQPALGADDMSVEKSRAKQRRTHQSRHRDVVENGGSPGRSHARRYAARGDIPAPSAPGFRLFPFLPIFLPF
jgi:hypothetical protein